MLKTPDIETCLSGSANLLSLSPEEVSVKPEQTSPYFQDSLVLDLVKRYGSITVPENTANLRLVK
jgi:hypothetical protein